MHMSIRKEKIVSSEDFFKYLIERFLFYDRFRIVEIFCFLSFI